MTDGFPPQTKREKTHSRYVMIDVETDGPIPGDYSMIAIAAVVVEPGLTQTFKRYVRPLPGASYQDEALAVGGFTRVETMDEPWFEDPRAVMEALEEWLSNLSITDKLGFISKPIFIADNNGFDWMFVCWYFWHFLGRNPFGFSSQNLNSLYKGLTRDAFASFKHLRRTKHDHNPLNDAMGNAEALIHMINEMGLRAPL